MRGKGEDAHRSDTKKQRKHGKILHEISLHEGQKPEKHPRTQETESPARHKIRDYPMLHDK